MDRQELQSISFQLVANVGEASAHFSSAINHARDGEFDEAESEITSANECIVRAHESQTDLLRAEVSGEEIEFSLLLVHAQDHLMTTITFGRLAEEFVRLYREVHCG